MHAAGIRPLLSLVPALPLALAACADLEPPDPELGQLEGVAYDSENPEEDVGADHAGAPTYEVPTDLPDLVAPEVIISLDGLTVHLFDRATGFSAVYPAGVGVIGSSGHSITPVGHFRTHPDTDNTWWYIARRYQPDYFAGLPFLRFDALNSRGQNTYGMHGPITEELIRDYVSSGCIRMARQDIIDLFWMVRDHASTPITIQREVELDAFGMPVDVGFAPALFAAGEPIPYGASVGPRPF